MKDPLFLCFLRFFIFVVIILVHAVNPNVDLTTTPLKTCYDVGDCVGIRYVHKVSLQSPGVEIMLRGNAGQLTTNGLTFLLRLVGFRHCCNINPRCSCRTGHSAYIGQGHFTYTGPSRVELVFSVGVMVVCKFRIHCPLITAVLVFTLSCS